MRLRIDRSDEGGSVTLRVSGWLDAPGADELRRVCAGAPPPVRLDVSELRAAHASGLDVLLALQRGGAVLSGVSPYIELLLSARRRRGGGKAEARS